MNVVLVHRVSKNSQNCQNCATIWNVCVLHGSALTQIRWGG